MFEVRPAGPSDLPGIRAIQEASPEAAQWSVSEDCRDDVRVAVSGETQAGFLLARRLGPGESEILNLAVAPAFRRMGVATALIQAWIRECPGGLFLEVRESNEAARKLYKFLNFVEVGRRKEYYAAPPEAGIVLKFHSC